jgi:D-serine deaminase-like pyridoxal phosphate-dependent protein
MTIHDLETPCAIVDLDRLEANIGNLQAYLGSHGIANRPHMKTHKVPEIAMMQMKAGAIGTTCQKLGEAEVMADGGIEDIFLPYNLLGAAKLDRLVKLARRAKVSVTADSTVVVEGLSAAFRGTGLTLPVLVEFDTGIGRCGVQAPGDARALARTIAASPGLAFGGLMTYPHNEQTVPFVEETTALLARDGLKAGIVSLGGTSGMKQAHTRRGVTEYRAGMYVFGDRSSIASGATTLAKSALTILTTVVSRPTESRGILDAGSKTLSSDLLGLEGHGFVVEYPEATIGKLTEEHGQGDFGPCPRKPKIGERVRVIPNHCCQIANLLGTLYGVRGEEVRIMWPVLARGKVA